MVAPVIVYRGRMFDHGCAAEPALARELAATIDGLGSTEAFGPLACGGDILIAEAMLERGGRIEIVLPFAEDDFIAESVVSGGAGWLPRYERCRDAAAAVHFATPLAYVHDENQFYYNTRFAMGLGVLRARELGTDAVQLAVVSEHASLAKKGIAGTTADIGIWAALGKRTIEVEAKGVERKILKFPPKPPNAGETQREIRSILFADYKGFSALGERELPLFMEQVMGRIGKALKDKRFRDHVEFTNTWGDALYAIVDTPSTAARLALELQEALRDLPAALMPKGAAAGMRIGLHYAPIYVDTDRVTGGDLWYGGEVNRTARIEPVAAIGEVYCTESFASALVLDGADDVAIESLGICMLAKDFGEMCLYRLTRA